MAILKIVTVATLFASACGVAINTSVALPHVIRDSECYKKSGLRIKPGSAAMLQDNNVPGAGIVHFEPFAMVLKDGFMKVSCVKDAMYYEGDKFGDNKHDYKLEKSAGVSIVHYEAHIAKEDRKEMTQEVCFNFCRTIPNMGFFGIVNGRGCYCTPYFRSMESDSSMCSSVCEGDKTLMCGGKSKSSIFSMHMCADTKEELDKHVETATSLKANIAAESKTLAETSVTLQKAGEKIQGAFGAMGDTGATGLGQAMKVYAGELEHTADKGAEAKEKFENMVLDAKDIVNPPTPAPTPAPITLHNTSQNNGAAYCSAYCAYNWNSEMPSNFKGACCLNAFNAVTNEKVSCTEETPVPAPPPPPSPNQIEVGGNNGAAYCSSYCAYNWNNEISDWSSQFSEEEQWKGACCLSATDSNNNDPVSCTEYGSGAGTFCTCQRNDDTPFLTGAGSSESFGQEKFPDGTSMVCAGETKPSPAPAPVPRAGLTCECQIQDTSPFLSGAGSGDSFTDEDYVCAGPIPPAPTPAPSQPKHFSDPNIVKQAEVVIEKIEEAAANGEALAENLDELNAEANPKSSKGAAAQYYPVMYFVNKKYEDVPSTCSGDSVGQPMVGDRDACAARCDAHIHDCVGFQFFDGDDAGGSTCTLLSNFKTGFYYTGCAKNAKSFLQTSIAAKTESAPFTATCYAKLSKYEGVSLKPNPSGKCEHCFKELTKANRCY